MRETRSTHFPDDVLEKMFNFADSHRDRNSFSLVCKSWHRAERFCRRHVLVGNCYALGPERVVSRFPNLRALTLKGRPRFGDPDLAPPDWGASVDPWIRLLARSCPLLRDLRFKRMLLSDRCLAFIAISFPHFRALVLVACHGFSSKGIAVLAANCRHLEVLDMRDNAIEDDDGWDWLSFFPDSCTSLVSLNFASLEGKVNLTALERLVGRCPNLRKLRLNKAVPFDTLQKILDQAPQLVDLGTGSYVQNTNSLSYVKLCNAVRNCKSLVKLAGFFSVVPWCLPSVYPICSNLISLNLSRATHIRANKLLTLIQKCPKLQCLWILDSIGDKGLEMVASSCKELQELRVYTSIPYSPVTEKGLVAISLGCPKLRYLVYSCFKMTNAALITVAKNCTDITHFKLCMLISTKPDHSTTQPLDEGYGAIVQSCKGLKKLSLSGLLTDQVFLYIAMYGERLEKLSIGFAGESDTALLYVLNGCPNLRKLEIRSCPFGDAALRANIEKHEAMQFLLMSSCRVTLGACKELAKKVPTLSVEIINKDQVEENADKSQKVDNMYLYRTLDGPRKDAPSCVWIL